MLFRLDAETIGVDEGDYSQIDRNDTIYYLDIIHQEVRGCDYEGNWIINVAPSGGGSGELQSPRGFTLISNVNRAIIAGQHINHVFQRRENKFELVATHRPKYPSINGKMGAMNGHYYLVS